MFTAIMARRCRSHGRCRPDKNDRGITAESLRQSRAGLKNQWHRFCILLFQNTLS